MVGRMDPLLGRLLVSSSGGWLAYVKCLSGRSRSPSQKTTKQNYVPQQLTLDTNAHTGYAGGGIGDLLVKYIR